MERFRWRKKKGEGGGKKKRGRKAGRREGVHVRSLLREEPPPTPSSTLRRAGASFTCDQDFHLSPLMNEGEKKEEEEAAVKKKKRSFKTAGANFHG